MYGMNHGAALRGVLGGYQAAPGMPDPNDPWGLGQVQPQVFDVGPLFNANQGSERMDAGDKIFGLSPQQALVGTAMVGAAGDVAGGIMDWKRDENRYQDHRADVDYERDRNRRGGRALMQALGRVR